MNCKPCYAFEHLLSQKHIVLLSKFCFDSIEFNYLSFISALSSACLLLLWSMMSLYVLYGLPVWSLVIYVLDGGASLTLTIIKAKLQATGLN